MECPVCLERYSAAGREAKLLPCGHAGCAPCLRRAPRCPLCRKTFDAPTESLPTVFALMGDNQDYGGPGGWWCTECEALSSPHCRRRHLLVCVQEAVRRRAGDVAPRAAEAARGLADALHAVAEEPARTALALLAGPAEASLRVTLRRPASADSDAAACTAQWNLADGPHDALARALLCQLAAGGLLQRAECPPRIVRNDLEPGGFVDELCVREVSLLGRAVRQGEKTRILERVARQGVRRIVNLYCAADPGWCLRILTAAAPTLEELKVFNPFEEHLVVVHAMPRLRRLAVEWDGALEMEPAVVLPPLTQPSCLKWLRQDLPAATLESLLRAHAASLETLWVLFGVPGRGEGATRCDGLTALLAGCGLTALRRLVISRPWDGHDDVDPSACARQLAGLMAVLPAARVLCRQCDRVPIEPF